MTKAAITSSAASHPQFIMTPRCLVSFLIFPGNTFTHSCTGRTAWLHVIKRYKRIEPDPVHSISKTCVAIVLFARNNSV